MLNVWLAVPAVLAAAILAACFTYLFSPSQPVEPNRRSPPTVSDMTTRPDSRTSASIDQRRSAEDHAVAAFQRAAERRGRRPPDPAKEKPVADAKPQRRQEAAEDRAGSLTTGKLNAVRAAFKAGVKPSAIARQFGISQSDVRKALAQGTRREA